MLYVYNYHDSIFANKIPHPFFCGLSLRTFTLKCTYALELNSSEIIKFTRKYTSNTENLVKMIFTWHNTSNI